jgi:hypothetical protein
VIEVVLRSFPGRLPKVGNPLNCKVPKTGSGPPTETPVYPNTIWVHSPGAIAVVFLSELFDHR